MGVAVKLKVIELHQRRGRQYMNNLNKHWSKFKQELLPIVYVSAIQIWFLFNFPPRFMRLGSPWNVILITLQIIIAVSCTIFIFSFADKLEPFISLKYLDAFPHAQTFKMIQRIWLLAIFVIGAFFVWYKDFYGMSNMGYLLLYSFWIITFILLYRAAYRAPSE